MRCLPRTGTPLEVHFPLVSLILLKLLGFSSHPHVLLITVPLCIHFTYTALPTSVLPLSPSPNKLLHSLGKATSSLPRPVLTHTPLLTSNPFRTLCYSRPASSIELLSHCCGLRYSYQAQDNLSNKRHNKASSRHQQSCKVRLDTRGTTTKEKQ